MYLNTDIDEADVTSLGRLFHAFAHHNIPRSYRVDVGAKQQTSLEKEVMKTLQRHNLSNQTLLHTSQR